MTDTPRSAVEQAKDNLARAISPAYRDPTALHYINALIAAVRAESAQEIERLTMELQRRETLRDGALLQAQGRAAAAEAELARLRENP